MIKTRIRKLVSNRTDSLSIAALSQLKLLRIEQFSVLAITLLVILSSLFKLQLYQPGTDSKIFIFKHYLVVLFVLALGGSLLPTVKRAPLWRLLYLRLIISLIAIIYAHFNFKLWAQLINPHLLDATYQQIETNLEPLHSLCLALAHIFETTVFNWPSAYHDVFVGMFSVSMIVHANVGPRSLERLLSVIAAILVLGGLTYMLAPALGPFSLHSNGSPTQAAMYAFQHDFIQSGGKAYQGDNFTMGLGAMPSLHVAHAFALTWLAFRDYRPLGWLYALVLLYLGAEAVASGFHYLIDIPAGMVIAGMSLWLARVDQMQEICASDHKQSADQQT